MAIREIVDRRDQLFGREADLRKLCDRATRTGLTAVIGPPQIGKSWLLTELARRLADQDMGFSVGLTRSPRGAPDPLLQVVSDLYQRWLADARAWEQLKAAWEQQHDRLLPNFAKFVGKLSEKAAKFLPIGGELLGTTIKESLEGLVAASEDLKTGRLIVSRLEYGQAQKLVESIHAISGRPTALVMDQWEETGSLDAQANILRDFLREPEAWAGCHIFLGIREGTAAETLLRKLLEQLRALADAYPDNAAVREALARGLSAR